MGVSYCTARELAHRMHCEKQIRFKQTYEILHGDKPHQETNNKATLNLRSPQHAAINNVQPNFIIMIH
jgi:hypothetical protein